MVYSKAEIRSKYSRIISLAPSNTEIIYAIGSEKLLIGLTRFCDYPDRAKAKQRIGGWLDIDFEKILSLRPDLVLASSFVQDKIVRQLISFGANVIQYDPKTLNQVYDSINDIGELTGKVENAGKLINKMKNSFDALNSIAKNLPKKRIYVEEWHMPPTVSGNWVPKIIEMANCESLIQEGIISRKVSFEEVKEFNPNYMIVSWCGFGKNINIDIIKNRPGWNTLRFIKEHKIIVLDDSLLNRPGPRLVEGLSEIIKNVNMSNKI